MDAVGAQKNMHMNVCMATTASNIAMCIAIHMVAAAVIQQ
jgi:hypothetical protein